MDELKYKQFVEKKGPMIIQIIAPKAQIYAFELKKNKRDAIVLTVTFCNETVIERCLRMRVADLPAFIDSIPGIYEVVV